MRPLLASLFDSLDGVTYFFVSSAIFVLVPAVLFFSLGLWIGALTWGRFKRRFRAGQETIEDMKNELALLKRRTADLASRALPHQSVPARAASKSLLTAPDQSTSKQNPLKFPKSRAFTVWTEHGWNPHPRNTPAPPRGTPFTIWMDPSLKPAQNVVQRPTRENPPAAVRSSVVTAASSKVKSTGEFPKAGAGTPTFGDWLHSRTIGVENGDFSGSTGMLSPAEAFRAEINAGIARNDYLLGIVFITPPAQRDDLSRLDDISVPECNALEACGVHSFKQIGFWDRDHADEFARRLGLKDKARAVKWIGQAIKLLQETRGAAS